MSSFRVSRTRCNDVPITIAKAPPATTNVDYGDETVDIDLSGTFTITRPSGWPDYICKVGFELTQGDRSIFTLVGETLQIRNTIKADVHTVLI